MAENLMDPEAVAEHLRIKAETLYQWRYRGIGPRGIKVGGRLRYRPSDVAEWLDQQAAAS